MYGCIHKYVGVLVRIPLCAFIGAPFWFAIYIYVYICVYTYAHVSAHVRADIYGHIHMFRFIGVQVLTYACKQVHRISV